MRKPILLTSAVALAALALAGCSNPVDDIADEQSQESTTEETPAEDTAEEPDEAEEPEADPAPAGEIAAPGTELSVGDTATVLWPDTDDGEQNVNVTVSDVSKADKSDFDAIDDDDFKESLDGYDVYYFTVEMDKAEPFTVPMDGESPTSEMYAFDANENRLGPVRVIGSFDACDSNYMSSEEDESNSGMSTCFISAIPEGQEPGYIAWVADETGYDYHDGEPLKWMI
ncbi:hypothetical protein [Microbacterium halotolerans]|uniref:hypothetical protein n=1 Tax=Microbacterium halotolerans TaxID=246613 RepID=UPI000E6AC1F9|nr:hypothetical protein [Microbacterium halotolerans]